MFAAILVPTVSQCVALAGPFLAGGGIFWFWRHGDELIAWLFPHLKWERELGWLNLRANRRAEHILRGLTHAGHFVLLLALAGILGFAWLLGQPHDTDTAIGLFSIPFEFIYLVLFLGIWIVYLATMLAPRVKAEFEEAELKRYRLEHPEPESERPIPRREADEPMRITVWDASRPRRRF